MKRIVQTIIAFACVLLAFTSQQVFTQTEEAPETMTGLKVGEKAPDFTLKDQEGKEHSLTSLLAKEGTAVLVFYRSADW